MRIVGRAWRESKSRHCVRRSMFRELETIGRADDPPQFFVSVADKEVTGLVSASVASKGLASGRFRTKHGKTRRSSVSVADKGVAGEQDEGFKVEEWRERS